MCLLLKESIEKNNLEYLTGWDTEINVLMKTVCKYKIENKNLIEKRAELIFQSANDVQTNQYKNKGEVYQKEKKKLMKKYY